MATCEPNDFNPIEYLADVLVQVNEYQNSKIDEPLPHEWQTRRAMLSLRRPFARRRGAPSVVQTPVAGR